MNHFFECLESRVLLSSTVESVLVDSGANMIDHGAVMVGAAEIQVVMFFPSVDRSMDREFTLLGDSVDKKTGVGVIEQREYIIPERLSYTFSVYGFPPTVVTPETFVRETLTQTRGGMAYLRIEKRIRGESGEFDTLVAGSQTVVANYVLVNFTDNATFDEINALVTEKGYELGRKYGGNKNEFRVNIPGELSIITVKQAISNLGFFDGATGIGASASYSRVGGWLFNSQVFDRVSNTPNYRQAPVDVTNLGTENPDELVRIDGPSSKPNDVFVGPIVNSGVESTPKLSLLNFFLSDTTNYLDSHRDDLKLENVSLIDVDLTDQ